MSNKFTKWGLSQTEFLKYFYPEYYDDSTLRKTFKLWMKFVKQQNISKCQSVCLWAWLFHQIFLSDLKFWKILISANDNRWLQIRDTSPGNWLSCRFALRTKWRWAFIVILLEIYFTTHKYQCFSGQILLEQNQPLSISQHGGKFKTYTRLTPLRNQN